MPSSSTWISSITEYGVPEGYLADVFLCGGRLILAIQDVRLVLGSIEETAIVL